MYTADDVWMLSACYISHNSPCLHVISHDGDDPARWTRWSRRWEVVKSHSVHSTYVHHYIHRCTFIYDFTTTLSLQGSNPICTKPPRVHIMGVSFLTARAQLIGITETKSKMHPERNSSWAGDWVCRTMNNHSVAFFWMTLIVWHALTCFHTLLRVWAEVLSGG